MKKLIFSFIVMLSFSLSGIAQPEHDMGPRVPERIRQLEKIKLIETLEMNEETTLKFFARRTEFEKGIEKLHNEIGKKLEKLEKRVNDETSAESDIIILLDQISELQQQVENNKAKFLKSLEDILSTRQIAKLVLFERNFREELRRAIFKDKRQRNRK